MPCRLLHALLVLPYITLLTAPTPTLLHPAGWLNSNQVACDRLRREFGVEVQTGRAYVAYREGISEKVEM